MRVMMNGSYVVIPPVAVYMCIRGIQLLFNRDKPR